MNDAGTALVHPALRITRLTAGYGAHPVLQELSLEVPAGQWCAVLGPNGSGKSTLLYSVAGLLRPRSGQIELSGVALQSAPAAAKRALGFACAPERLPDLLTGRQCLQVYAAAKGLSEIDGEVLELGAALSVTGQLDAFVDTYSLGTRQKLAVLLALLGAPRLIVLDEAFNGLDPASAGILKRHLRRLVDERRAAVLLATHALEIVERYADRVALLLAGRIVHEWSASELAARRSGGESLEDLLAAAATEQSGTAR
ncbi:MAG: ATP-binding cassette domain-containing protein [Steroidobacteraceae bacterium]